MGEHVLVPHDGSEQAGAALRFAFETYPDASVTVFHAVEPFPEHTDAGVENGGRWYDRARTRAEKVFEGSREIATAYERTVETEWRYGRPRHEIVRYVEENDVDHVVMGSHGRDGLDRILLGSVAEIVVRRSPVPVTVVR